MPYRPITPLKGPGIVAMEALYDEQEGARQAQRTDAARSRAAVPSRRLAAALLAVALLVVTAVAALPRSGPGATPSAVLSLATLAGDAPTTTAFDGQRYTIAFTAVNPLSIVADGRMYAVKQPSVFGWLNTLSIEGACTAATGMSTKSIGFPLFHNGTPCYLWKECGQDSGHEHASCPSGRHTPDHVTVPDAVPPFDHLV